MPCGDGPTKPSAYRAAIVRVIVMAFDCARGCRAYLAEGALLAPMAEQIDPMQVAACSEG
jgi:hypothetical protein